MSDLAAEVCAAATSDGSPLIDAYNEDRVRTLSDREVVGILAQKIGRTATLYYPSLGARALQVTGSAWGGKGNARTFRFEIRPESGQGAHTVFVKLYPVYERFNPALFEYETLKLLHERMPALQENCRVSRPLDFYPDLNAYVMESAGTRSFKHELLKNNSRLRRDGSLAGLFSILSGCAIWLKTFHGITRSKAVRKFDFHSYLDSINQECEYRSLRKYRFRRDTIQAMDRVMHKLASCGGLELPCAKSHWDFTPDHVYLDEGRIRVIDILGGDDIPIYEDLGHFLAALSTINNLPWYPLFDHRRAETELCDRFIDAYAQGREHDPERFMLFTQIYKLKHLIIWFGGQRMQVDRRIHPAAGALFANFRLVGLFERALLRTVGDISRRIGGLA